MIYDTYVTTFEEDDIVVWSIKKLNISRKLDTH